MKPQTTKKPRFDNAMNFATPESKTKPKSEKAVIRINADIRADLFQKIKIEAVRRNTSIKTLIEELIQNHI